MDRKEFISMVRSGKAGTRIDDVEIAFPGTRIVGSGTFECESSGFRIKVRLPEGEMPPPIPSAGFLGPKDCGTLTGVINHDLPFRVTRMFPSCSMTNSNGRITLDYGASSIELIPQGWDNLTTEAKKWIHEQVRLDHIKGEFSVDISELSGPDSPASSVQFSGLLLDYELIAKHGATKTVEKNDFLGERTFSKADTVYGQLSPQWDFALIQRDGDAEFHLRSREGFKSENEDADQDVLTAFQMAVAFVQGQHAWPFTLEYWRDGRFVVDRIHPPRNFSRTPHHPFSERIWFNARTDKIEWCFENALAKAFSFFHEKSELSEEVSKLLYFVREAKGPTTNIVFCSLLESLIKAIFEAQIAPKDHGGMSRGKKDHREVPVAKMFRAVVEHLHLPWENDWEVLCAFWKENRNRLVHRATKTEDDDTFLDYLIESRVAGAINMLILKLMGYQGYVVSSVYEDQFKQI